MQRQRALVAAGEGQRLIMAGGGSSWLDLGLFPIARCQEWAVTGFRERTPVAAMARLTGVPERTLVRRFQRATGLTPIQYIQTVRIEEAKQLLETGAGPIEAIAAELGYEDPRFFMRLFKREVKLTPAPYRCEFGQLRAVLRTARQD